MMKKVLAVLCVLAMVASMCVMPVSATETPSDTYQVGYAKRDINPWVELTIDTEGTKIGIPANRGLDENGNPIPYTDADTNIVTTKIHDPLDHSKIIETGFVSLPMGGYGNSDERHATCMTDDNGDGYISYGDGVYFTCTSVTDSYGKTVMYMTVDTTSIGSGTVDLIREGIVKRLSNQVISKNEIVINANHSHSSMSFTAGTEGSAYQAYYYYMIDRAVDAACEAYNTRSQATMSKGSIESSDAMKKMGYVNEDGSGLVMNYVRHQYSLGNFQKSTYNATTGKWSTWQQFHKEMEKRIELIRTPHSGGTCFPTPGGDTKYKSYVALSDKGSVSPVDETMHVLRFDRAEGDPVVMVNWRGHSTRNGGGGNNKNISGDYANNLRYRLENNKTLFGGDTDYCVAFWQGASGNVNTGGHGNLWYDAINENNTIAPMDTQDEVKVKFAELGTDADGNATVTVSDDPFYHEYYNSFLSSGALNYDNRFYYCAKYGYLLAKIAMDCMENNMQQCDTGPIRSKQIFAQWDRQQYTYGQYLAAKEWDAAGRPDGNTVFPYWYDDDLNGDGILERYILNSDFHAKNVLNRYVNCDPDLDGKDLIPVDEQSKASMELDAITMGTNVAIVTIPGEPFDRYSSEATLETAALYNDWDKLITEEYGTPFVMGYSNDGTGYLPNTLAYDYLSEKRVPLTSSEDTFNNDEYYKQYYNVYDPGSYESNTSRFERGTGEKVIEKLKSMLETLQAPPRTAYCEACKQEVTWEGLSKDTMIADLSHGHYYLEEDLTTQSNEYQKHVGTEDGSGDPVTVCLDLNGKHYTHFGRIFVVYKNGTLNVMDSQTGGTITAKPGAYNVGGGMMSLDGTLNLYGGKLEFVNDQSYLERYNRLNRQTAYGGVISGKGTVNLYDGIIQGGEMGIAYQDDQNPEEGLWNTYAVYGGGTIYLNGYGTLNLYGGQILGGKAAKNTEGLKKWYDTGTVDDAGNPIYELRTIPDANGDCVYLAGTYTSVNLYNDAQVDDIYFGNKGTKNKVSVYGDFTGRAALQYNPNSVTLGESNTIGDASSGASIDNATLTYSGAGQYRFAIRDNKLMMIVDTSKALVGTKGYETLDAAMENYSLEDGPIKLLDNVGSATVTKPVAIDLNGYNIDTLTTTDNGVVYGMDSQTDDYQIEGDAENGYFGYGKIKNYSGADLVGMSVDEEVVANSYLMVKEADGASFHCVNLQLTHMSLKAKVEGETEYNPSLYYKSTFAGDALVAANVKTFGVALSTVEEPNATNMGDTNKFSWFDGSKFKAGENNNDATSTLLYGVMKETNAKLTNKANAVKPIYGRAYVQLQNGQYVFGYSACRTLKQQIEEVDANWSSYTSSQKKLVVQMYQVYSDVLNAWNIPNIKAAAQ